MASIYKENKSDVGTGASLDLISSIKQFVDSEREKTSLNYDEYLFFLKRWWCNYYKRPYKDPLLDTYTFEELYFEYCDVNYINNKENTENANTDEIPQDEWDWAAEEEAKEQAEMQSQEDHKPITEDDTIDESVGLPDEEWADNYSSDTKVNPDADSVNEGGDIFATFES